MRAGDYDYMLYLSVTGCPSLYIKDAATPKTFERYTSMPEGALYSFDQSVGVRRPYFKTPIKGLYLASSSTFLGGE